MRLIFVATGAYGHIFPMLPLALAGRDAGHDVVFATAEEYHAPLSAAGLKTLAAGATVTAGMGQALRARPGVPPTPHAFGDVLARRAIADLAPVLDRGDADLVVYEALSPGAGIAAGLAGVRAVCHGLGRVSGGPNWQALEATWMATATDYGLALPSVAPEFFGNTYLDICPPSIQLPRIAGLADRMPLRPSAWEQPATLPASVADRDADRPLVYATLGTLHGRSDVLRTILDGLARLPADVIVTLGNQEISASDLGDLPTHVTIERWVSAHALLPHVDLVVSHGGSATTLETLAQGLPHLVLPQGADQFSNAQVVVDAGLGVRLLPSEVTAEAVGEQAAALLADAHDLGRVRQVAAEIAGMPSPEDVIGRLTAA